MSSVWMELFLLRILPVVALLLVGKFKKVYVFAGVFLLMVPAAYLHKFNLIDLGFNFSYSNEGLIGFMLISAVFGSLCYIFARWEYSSERLYPPESHTTGFQLVYFFISVPLQQFLAFGYLFPLLSSTISDKTAIALIMGLLFGFTHIAWKKFYFVIGTTLLGITWAFAYVYSPTLVYPIISHCILATCIALGIKGRSNALLSLSD